MIKTNLLTLIFDKEYGYSVTVRITSLCSPERCEKLNYKLKCNPKIFPGGNEIIESPLETYPDLG